MPPLTHLALLNHAITLLANRQHAAGELHQKLLRLLLRQQARATPPAGDGNEDAAPPLPPPQLAAAVIQELQRRGLLDDAAYAAWHAAQRAAPSGRPRSRAQLGAELAAKRLAPDLVRAHVAAHSELAACAAAALRKPSLSGPRLAEHLKWKGFAFWAVDRVREARQAGLLEALLEEERARQPSEGGGELQ